MCGFPTKLLFGQRQRWTLMSAAADGQSKGLGGRADGADIHNPDVSLAFGGTHKFTDVGHDVGHRC